MDTLKIFIRVTELKSFSRAAEDLALPRATVSAAVAQLEAAVGTRLLQRTTRKLSLTQDGFSILERAHMLLDEFEALHHQFRANSAPLIGKLNVDLPSRIARRVVIPALPDFLARHPELHITVGADDRIIDLIEEGVDCAIRLGPLSENSLVAKYLGTVEMINCASPSYVKANSKLETIDDLVFHTAVHYGSKRNGNLNATETDWLYLDSDGLQKSVPIPCRISVHTAETYIASAVAGLGLIQVPAFDVRNLLEEKQLIEVMPLFRPAPLPVNALYPHRKHLSPRVRIFIEWVGSLIERKINF
ncbi:LysR family transcriptional regulator [Methylovorus menthalis]|uniref:LysR substrate-binding domain-containing protein n=1 Tax=Methylovorus menthalis TaxID=1002227 RepID=UPI001E3C23E9|nr:LysR family transcriptional regulator [Methylovorus menthalis]MCB4809840.1 LysR family transcriptional regulator [Methylovorus menthalis]